MEWDRLKTFYLVANCKSFLEAAKRLNITQSSLSKNISILEHQLKTQLFVRHARGITLTKQGLSLFATAQKVYNELEAVSNAMLDDLKLAQGILKITATHGIANVYLLPVLPLFLKEYPLINLQIFASDILPDFEFGESDIAFCPRLAQNDNLIQKTILKHPTGLVASQEYLARQGTPQCPEDLDGHQLIATITNAGSHIFSFDSLNWHLTLGAKTGIVRTPYATMNTAQGRLYLAEQGLGIASIALDHPGIDKMNLVRVLPHIPGPELDSCLIYSTQLKNSKRIKLFQEFLIKYFGTS